MGKHLKQKPTPERAAQRQKKTTPRKQPARPYSPPRKTFLDMIAPGVMKFSPDMYIRDNLYCCVWALKEYPAATEDQAILRHLGEKCGVNLRIYTRIVDAMEENRIIQNATNKNKLNRANTNDTKQMITAEGNLQDVFEMVNTMRKRREPLIHCAVFIELCAPTIQELERLQSEVISELLRSKLNVDRLRLRQQKGHLSTCPQGYNSFGTQFERVLPASSVANLYIYNYSGKTDAHGFYIGKDRYGSNILTDFDQRDEDKTSANVLILGNSGQGKSYLMKLLMVNCREAGKNIISLDVEHEQSELCLALDGCFIDLMGGQYIINVLEPKCWSTGDEEDSTLLCSIVNIGTDDDRLLIDQRYSFVKNKWTLSLDESIHTYTTGSKELLVYTDEYGLEHVFTLLSGTENMYVSADSDDIIQKSTEDNSEEYALQKKDGTTKVFHNGYLQSKTNTNGCTFLLAYNYPYSNDSDDWKASHKNSKNELVQVLILKPTWSEPEVLINFIYDQAGNCTEIVTADGNSLLKYEYGDKENPSQFTSIIISEHTEIELQYDKRGNLSRIVDKSQNEGIGITYSDLGDICKAFEYSVDLGADIPKPRRIVSLSA